MAEMTSHQRFKRMFEHRQADRVPIIDAPWGSTIERWHREGLPKDVDWQDCFGMDRTGDIGMDNSPRYPVKTLEETDDYVVHTSAWGVTMRNWKHAGSTPEFLHHTIVDADSWRQAKKRMTPTRDRIDWDRLKENYPKWRREGAWITAGLWFGFDVTHSWMVGTERVLIALIEQPDWLFDMFNHQLDVQLQLLEMLYAEGYSVDALSWPDDMGYKGTQFFSLDVYRRLVKPVQKRACDWARAHGAFTHLHSCGNVNPFIPEFIEIGIDALNPLEVKAGMDPLAIKAQYGDRLVLHGGINAVLWTDVEAIEAEMRRVVPKLKENGGYVFSSDHSVPDAVSLENFRRIIELARELGAY